MRVSVNHIGLAAACLLALAACSGKKSEAGAGDTAAAAGDVGSFIGTWKLTGSIPGPWVVTGFTPEPNPDIASAPLVLAETSSSGPAILTCAETKYEVTKLPVEGLFEGNLTDIENDARSIGVEPDAKNIPTLMEGCVSTTADLELNYHLIDENTLLLGLDNTIYQFARQP